MATPTPMTDARLEEINELLLEDPWLDGKAAAEMLAEIDRLRAQPPHQPCLTCGETDWTCFNCGRADV